METNQMGIYWILKELPLWATFMALTFIAIGALPLIRSFFENLACDVSMTHQLGNFALIGCVLIAAEILKSQKAIEPWLENLAFQAIWFGISIGLIYHGIVMMIKSPIKSDIAASAYQNLVIVPTLVFLLGTTLPIAYLYGSLVEKSATILFLLFWLATIAFDIKQGRLNQVIWLAERGVTLPLKRI